MTPADALAAISTPTMRHPHVGFWVLSAAAEFGVMIFANDAAVDGVTRVPAGGSVAADVMVIPAPHGFVGRIKFPVNVPERTSESPGCAALSAACRSPPLTGTTRVAFANVGAGMDLGNSATVARTVLVSGGGGGGGGAVVDCTVSASDPMIPSTVALITTWPAANPLTTPDEDTDATLGAELDQMTVRPLRTALWPSRTVAVSCVVWPAVIDVVPVTDTDATGTTGAVTVSAMLALLPSLVAVMFEVPAPTACTVPEGETTSTPRLELDHAMVRPLSTFPCASFTVTAIACDCPTNIDVDVALSEIVATGGGAGLPMTSVAEPDCPSLVATIVAVPAAIVVTAPLADTVANVGAALVQVTVLPVRMVPDASRRTAEACVDWPTVSDWAASETATVATGACGGALTAMAALAVFPSTLAVIVALPCETPVTRPLLETVAIVGFDDDHAGTRDVSGL